MSQENSRIAARKYHELADDVRLMKGWSKAEVAEKIRNCYPQYEVKNDQIYEWFEGKGDPRTSFSKAVESVLGINLPSECYWNVGKR